MKKGIIVGFLIIMLVSVSCVSAISVTTSEHIKQMTNDEKIKLLWGLNLIYINVKEIYGDTNNPQYRPLSDVKITLKYYSFVLFEFGDKFDGYTGEAGFCDFVAMHPGWYTIKATKDGYRDISSGIIRFHVLDATAAGLEYDVGIILAKNGSPFTKQINSKCLNVLNTKIFSRIMEKSNIEPLDDNVEIVSILKGNCISSNVNGFVINKPIDVQIQPGFGIEIIGIKKITGDLDFFLNDCAYYYLKASHFTGIILISGHASQYVILGIAIGPIDWN